MVNGQNQLAVSQFADWSVHELGDFRTGALINPLMGTLKPQSNGPLNSNTVIGTLTVDGWAQGCYIWYSEEGTGRAAPPLSPVLAVTM